MAHVAIPEEYADEPRRIIDDLAPAMAEASHKFSSTVYQETKLPFRVVEAARIRTSQINGCQTCQTWRAERDLPPSLLRRGFDPSRSFVGRGDEPPDEAFYEAVADWETSPVFSERERLAIEFAERMGERPKSFEGDEAFWTRMRAAFTDAEIVDLTVAVGCWIGAGRTLHVLGVDPAVCAIPVGDAAH
jgi:alkylhydroperoxidase family enzyme